MFMSLAVQDYWVNDNTVHKKIRLDRIVKCPEDYVISTDETIKKGVIVTYSFTNRIDGKNYKGKGKVKDLFLVPVCKEKSGILVFTIEEFFSKKTVQLDDNRLVLFTASRVGLQRGDTKTFKAKGTNNGERDFRI